MKRNSTTIFIESPSGDLANPCITPVPWAGNAPNWDGITEPTLSVLKAVWERDKNSIVVIPDPVPQPIVAAADWVTLCEQILGGALNGVYTRLTTACFLDPATATLQQLANANNIAVAAGKLDQAVAVTCEEGAVAASLQMLVTTSDYRFTQAEKDLWNATASALNFSALMQIA